MEIKDRDGLSFEEAALRFGISESSRFRWSKRLEPCLMRNKPATKIDPAELARDADKYPDAFQRERAQRFGCSQRGICAALKRLKISRKNNMVKPRLSDSGAQSFQAYVHGRVISLSRPSAAALPRTGAG